MTQRRDKTKFAFDVRPELLTICRMSADDAIPDWARESAFWNITRTGNELSIVCEEACVPTAVQCDRGWRAIAIQGPLDLAQTGVLLCFAEPLASAQIPIFAISTFDT